MPFSSIEFIFLFLPSVLVVYYTLARFGFGSKTFGLVLVASLIFYGRYAPVNIAVLGISVVVNYFAGILIERSRESGRLVSAALAIGVTLNLASLGYFKYTGFLVATSNSLFGTTFAPVHILLPLGISFYTFQQIGYLVEIARGKTKPGDFLSYSSFVIYFPNLLAGPITRYGEVAPQMAGKSPGRFALSNLVIGLSIFAIGLFKKTVIADSAAIFSEPVFSAAHSGNAVDFVAGWTAAVCYTIQLYFDFSGYSDMAIGASRTLGVKLPVNFHSPLRASSISDYWRRWHITLQRFIVSYMFQPCVVPLTRLAADLGLQRWGTFWLATAMPTLVIFTGVGLWHGAGWTFILFGIIHGTYLTVNEIWRIQRRSERKRTGAPTGIKLLPYHLLTLFCIVFANVLFRVPTVNDALGIWSGMLSLPTLDRLLSILPASTTEAVTEPFLFIVSCSAIVFLFPNTQQFMGRYSPCLGWSEWRHIAAPVMPFEFRLTRIWATVIGIVLFFGVAFVSRGQTEFIYFNF